MITQTASTNVGKVDIVFLLKVFDFACVLRLLLKQEHSQTLRSIFAMTYPHIVAETAVWLLDDCLEFEHSRSFISPCGLVHRGASLAGIMKLCPLTVRQCRRLNALEEFAMKRFAPILISGMFLLTATLAVGQDGKCTIVEAGKSRACTPAEESRAREEARRARNDEDQARENAQEAREQAQSAREEARDAADAAREEANEAREQAREQADQAREAAAEARDQAREQADAAREQANEVREQAQEAAQDAREQAQEAREQARDGRDDARDIVDWYGADDSAVHVSHLNKSKFASKQSKMAAKSYKSDSKTATRKLKKAAKATDGPR
jgi:hypothetical protein